MTGNATSESQSARITDIIRLLRLSYPDAKIALSYANPWELLVAVMLSAQCTDAVVNTVTKPLFRKYPSVAAFAAASQEALERDIHSTGFFRNKAEHIRAAASRILDTFGGNVPKTMEDLLTLPGVARKTANVVLGNAYGVVVGIAVDTHVLRISQRLRLVEVGKVGGNHPMIIATGKQKEEEIVDYVKDADPVKIETSLLTVIPKEEWFPITYRLINHGRAVCKAISPRCSQCPLASVCPVRRT